MENKLLISTIIASVIIFASIIIYSQSSPKQQSVIKLNSAIGEKDYYGMLTVDTDCMIPEGCGPKYKLWGSKINTYTPLSGDINKAHNELVVQVAGKEITLPKSEYDDMNYQGQTNAIEVKSYKTLSKIKYHEFLTKKAGEYTIQKYPCLASEEYGSIFTSWNKEFSWEIQNDEVTLKVRMTNTFSGEEPQPFYELWYDGNSGKFIKEVKEPAKSNFCGN